ncbi:hypothetical protein BK004_00425 [bacterium CG10_46_32]|nr:MAG: hypothetical protein BK004_00425 [bacterium CG10_46_32]PIR56584.1 MAG: hypothetical protein COU73_00420 [Parcubacteria group bacterium CG10_big_fil_rev_8_21_14_0_10_46_32]
MDHEDRVREARIVWEQARTTTTVSPVAKARLLRIELRKECILSSGIASEDSFRAVQNRLNNLWEEYLRRNPETPPPKPRLVARGDLSSSKPDQPPLWSGFFFLLFV